MNAPRPEIRGLSASANARSVSARFALFVWVPGALWGVGWGLLRGALAHGGYVWWEVVHHGGLFILLLTALLLSSATPFRIAARAKVLLTFSIVVGTWLSFQIGLALHQRPESVADFLLNEP